MFGPIILHVPEQVFIRKTNVQEQENRQTNKQANKKKQKQQKERELIRSLWVVITHLPEKLLDTTTWHYT